MQYACNDHKVSEIAGKMEICIGIRIQSRRKNSRAFLRPEVREQQKKWEELKLQQHACPGFADSSTIYNTIMDEYMILY